MTRQIAFIYPLIFALLIISNSCKKSNQTYPEVHIIEPTSGADFSYGDTIKISAKVVDWDGHYTISLKKDLVNVVVSSRLISSQGDTKYFETYYDRKDLEGGVYELGLTVFNGENSRSDFSEIYLNEVPLEFLGLLVLEGSSSDRKLVKVDQQMQAMEIKLVGEQTFLEYNAYQEIAIVAPLTSGKLTGYSIFPFDFDFELANSVQLGAPLFKGLVNSPQHIYSLAENGEVKAYKKTGNVSRSFVLPTELEPVSGCFSETGLMLCVKERGKENYTLQLRNAINGAVLKEQPLPAKGVYVEEVSSGVFMVALTKNTETLVAEYVPTQNVLTTLFKLAGTSTGLVSLEDGRIAVSTDQTIHLFNIQTKANPALLFNFGVSDMEYDRVNHSLLLANGKRVQRAGFDGSLSTEYVGSEIIQQIEVVYSK